MQDVTREKETPGVRNKRKKRKKGAAMMGGQEGQGYAKTSVYSLAGAARWEKPAGPPALRSTLTERKWLTRRVRIMLPNAYGVLDPTEINPGWIGQPYLSLIRRAYRQECRAGGLLCERQDG